MNNITADEERDDIRIRAGAAAPIGQGGVLLKKGIPYVLLNEVNDQQKVLYCTGSFTQEVLVAKTRMRLSSNPTSFPEPPNTEYVTAIIKTNNTSRQSTSDQSKALAPQTSLTITTSSRTYNHCSITLVEPDGLTISHSGGVSKIPFNDLPESYSEQYHYDSNKAAAYATEMAQQRAETAARNRKLSTASRDDSSERPRKGGKVASKGHKWKRKCPTCGGNYETKYVERSAVQRWQDYDAVGEYAGMANYIPYCPRCSDK
jgi:hypothetical protein